MNTLNTPEANTEFVDFWNEVLVPKFVKYKHVLVDGLTHHSAAIFPSLDIRAGDRALDVGCGFGDTAIQIAERVGSTGSVLGIDCCEAFLEYGRRDAVAAGLDNVSFALADVQFHSFQPEYDFCFSRFGTMFFENPVAALKNMRRALKPGGRLTFIVWRAIDDNPWLGLPKQVALNFLPPPGEDAATCGPGPFSMASESMVTKQLEIAGYEDIEFKRVDAPLLVGRSPEDAVGFQLALGPAGEAYREAGEEAEQKHDETAAAPNAELARWETPEGIVMQSSSCVISARNAG
jgi:SAM-dependent methyltransferase